MVSRRTAKLLVAGGLATVGLGLAYYLLSQQREGQKFKVTIGSTEGGTISIPADIYEYDVPTEITITATPDSGYEFHGWWLNGELVSSDLTFIFTTSGNDLLLADFREIGGPVLIPAYLKPLVNSVAEDWWKVYDTMELLTFTLHLEHDYYAKGNVKFKICDQFGVGVPDQPIAVYTESMPDPHGFGYLQLGDLVRTFDDPLIVTSDGLGEVVVPCRYMWDEPDSDYRTTIGLCGKVQYLCPIFLYFDVYPIKDRHYINRPCEYTKFTRMKHPIYWMRHAIHAYYVSNPSLPVYGDTFVECYVRIHGSKKF